MTNVTIQELFKNDINREINGVIKVDQKDDENAYTELDEYVLTKESLKHIDKFFGRYLKSTSSPTDKMGVWISGDFGSGKSHFLKIISYLLENKTVRGKTALDFFKTKVVDPDVYNTIEKSVNFGTKDVILLNIESKSGDRNERIVDTLMRVFNEKRGYCGDVFWIADLEERLERKGSLKKFKAEFQKISGEKWEERRDSYSFDQDTIIQALVTCGFQSEESCRQMFETDGKEYHLSVEKFAKILNEYCKSKGNDHQVIFLIDEIGAYIGDNSKLMLNLQTVVEDLGTLLKGKVWVIVTSQADIETALKEVQAKEVKQDFSKIQARFDTRLSLSSANVDEVIKKRILEKKEEHKEMLASFYAEKKIILKNLISFSQGCAEMKNYKNDEDFVSVYPFVPYQFNILQKVFEKIRATGFTGKHLAKGERSMLNAYKESAEKYGDCNVGILAPFYSFYDTIESFLDPIIVRTIKQAEENTHIEEFDCQIVKTLFMIRHVKEIQPTLDNIVVLSLTSVEQDKLKLKEEVMASLQRLESETLISKSGDTYHFLTNEEQEINREIKNIDIEKHKILQEVYDELFNSNNICQKSYGDYRFNKVVDDKITPSGDADLTIKFLTPLSDEILKQKGQHSLDDEILSDINSKDTLLFVFPKNSQFISQITSYLQITKYLTQNRSNRNDTEMQTILLGKQQEAENLKKAAIIGITQGAKDAKIFIDGVKAGIDVRNPKEMVKEGFDKLVQNVFSKSSYITREFESENDIIRLLKSDDLEKFGVGKSEANTLALDELLNYIAVRDERRATVVLNDIKDSFSRKPFGWKHTTISGLVATLFLSEAIKIRYQKTYLENNPEEVTKYLVRKEHADKVIVEIRRKTDVEIINAVRAILRNNFDKSDIPNKENDLFRYTRDILTEQMSLLSKIFQRYSEQKQYPGRIAVDTYSEFLENLIKITDPSTFLQKIADEKEELERLHHEVDPVLSFFSSVQVDIFQRILKKMENYQRNIQFFSEDAKNACNEIEQIISADEPYSRIKKLPQLEGIIEASLTEAVERLKKEFQTEFDTVEQDLKREISFTYQLPTEVLPSVMEPFYYAGKRVTDSMDCTEIKLQTSHLSDLIKDAYQTLDEEKRKLQSEKPGKAKPEKIIPTEIITSSSYFKTEKTIETEDDLEDYLSSLRTKLKKLLKTKKIKVH